MNLRSFLFGAVAGFVVGAMLLYARLAQAESKLAQYEAQEAAMAAHRGARAKFEAKLAQERELDEGIDDFDDIDPDLGEY